ncbi:small G protein, GTPase SAR1 [Xenococcus sp. PCC 7305]|uniref:YcjF family protein n=1 Tax=Xenococcus sp. PCC 7305 TaxID=102125 RepID=UPI0002ACB203|nr:GTP-binding protein [Xenococcus sp. PCC 7305]ELS01568.1 small G protein, GTPase SAR1 [Xenococcus sp. PCC 7305]
MSLIRLLILFVGLSLILGLSIWLVASLYRLYIQVSFTAPFLANFLLLLLIVLIGLLIAGFIYYFNFYTGKKGSRKRSRSGRINPKIPADKTQAAAQNLKAIGQQVGNIQDSIAREAFLRRSQEIEADLERGEIRIVVFGTGSSGKTSLVNSLIGDIMGDVNATMGTTTEGETYSLKLKGIAREILITDTPGILESGIAGTKREELARELATEADLLLFVVDNDLRQSEYNPLYDLANLGKRSLLILNKSDLYTEEDQATILRQLQETVKSFIASSDVIAIAANPQPVELRSGEIITPEPEIALLIKRLVAVLRAEGADLIADNILLQSHRLGEDARKIIDRQRRREADKIIDRYQWIGAGVIAITPLPVVDMLATAAVNAQMVIEIGRVYGCELDLEKGKELALSLGKTLVSLGVVKGTVDLLARALQFHFATYIVGKAIQGVSAAYLTRIAGKSFIEYFRRDRNWGDGGMSEVVQQQFQLTRKDEFMKSFVKDAISKVVQPMKDSWEEEELEPVAEDDW